MEEGREGAEQGRIERSYMQDENKPSHNPIVAPPKHLCNPKERTLSIAEKDGEDLGVQAME